MGDRLGRFLQDGELLLREFDNPEDLLQENSLFAKIFYSLCQGESPYKIIEQLVGMVDRYKEEMSNILQRTPTSPITIDATNENLDLIFREAFFSDSDFPDW